MNCLIQSIGRPLKALLHLLLKEKIKPMPHYKTIIVFCTTLVFAGCHNNPAQQQAATPTPKPAPVTMYDNNPDTSVVKAMVDKNAKEGINIIHYPNGMIRAKG